MIHKCAHLPQAREKRGRPCAEGTFGCLATISFVRGAALTACALTSLGILTASRADAREVHVLLVGVGKYQSLKPAFQLTGPPNDVRLVKDVLEGEPFHVKPHQITILTDWQTDKSLQPTRANIEREFARLATIARKGDQVFILMGGHGSQQPADDDANDFEPDGLDEIFLPSDVQGWDGSKGRVVNAIVDDEIRVWIERIRKLGAFTWIAFDSCHSGTMIRGTPSSVERERQIRMEDLVPEDARRKVRPAEGSRGAASSAQQASSELGTDSGDVVALYAAQPFETTPESGDRTYGLFTSTMTSVLKQARLPLTYRELAERISDCYRAMNRIGPTPMFEGTGVDREVLGQKTWQDRPQWTLALDSNKSLIVNAGRLGGLTRDSILEVFPPAGSADASKAVGYVKVSELRPLESVVEPAAFNSSPMVGADRLGAGSRCRLVQADFGEMTLRVGLQRQRDGAKADDVEIMPLASAPPAIAKAMNRLTELTRGLARPVDRSPEADWFIRLLADGRVVMVPASGLPGPTSASSAVKPATYEIARTIDETFEVQLVANVTRRRGPGTCSRSRALRLTSPPTGREPSRSRSSCCGTTRKARAPGHRSYSARKAAFCALAIACHSA